MYRSGDREQSAFYQNVLLCRVHRFPTMRYRIVLRRIMKRCVEYVAMDRRVGQTGLSTKAEETERLGRSQRLMLVTVQAKHDPIFEKIENHDDDYGKRYPSPWVKNQLLAIHEIFGPRSKGKQPDEYQCDDVVESSASLSSQYN
jgi:hypothetical protein